MEYVLYQKEDKIETSEEGIAYWATKINCEPLDLRDAISKVGDNYKVLILFLELNRKIYR